ARPRSCSPTAAACSRASSANSRGTTSSRSSRATSPSAPWASRPSGRAPRTSCSTGPDMTTIVRAQILHTPRDPFAAGAADALEAFSNGGLAYGPDGRIVGCGPFGDVRAAHPDAAVTDASDAVLVPGLVDLHVHYPQIAVIGAMGMTLLEWLATPPPPQGGRVARTHHPPPGQPRLR